MDQTQQNSRRLLLVLVAVVVIIFITATAVMIALFGTPKKQATTSTEVSSAQTTQTAVATKDDVQQNLSELDTSIKQAESDQTAAKAALNDSKNQVKLGN